MTRKIQKSAITQNKVGNITRNQHAYPAATVLRGGQGGEDGVRDAVDDGGVAEGGHLGGELRQAGWQLNTL